MDNSRVLDTLEQLTASSAQLLKRCERKMDDTAEEIQEKLDAALAENKREMIAFATQNVKAELETVLAQYKKDMDEAHEIMLHRTKEFNTYLNRVTEQNGKIARRSWQTAAVSLAAVAVVLFSAIWLAWHYADKIKSSKVQAEILDLIEHSDIVRCGDSLCAKTEKTNQNGYRIIKKH